MKKIILFLLSINDDIATIKEHRKLLPSIFEKLLTHFNLKLGGVALFDRDRESLGIIIGRYYPGGDFTIQSDTWGRRFSLDSIPFELPIQNPRVEVINSSNLHHLQKLKDNSQDFNETLNELLIDSLLFIPAQTSGKLLGFLILSIEGYSFDESDQDYLIKIGSIFASALSNTIAYEELIKKEKEKEIQIELISSLVAIKEKDIFYERFAQEFNKLIPIDFIALQAKNTNGISSIYNLVKVADDEFEVLNMNHSTEVAIQSLISKERLNKNMEFFEIFGSKFDQICMNSPYFEKLKDEYEIASIIFLNSSRSNLGELNLILGRKKYEPKLYDHKIDLIIFQNMNSLFPREEILLALGFLTQIGLILSNIYAFEEIKILTSKLEQEKNFLLDEINLASNFQEIIGTSESIKATLEQAQRVAPVNATVLIQGETGTGKELIARAIHNLSKRKDKTFITVNCAALHHELIESELFGHEKGSYTGAIDQRIGKFEVADGGTIFLDEIGELPLEIQSKLLRVLQENEFERLGGKGTIHSDVRIIAATNRDLETEVEQGKFRADLYFRLNVFPITVPPLRERAEDIPLLAKYFIEKYSKRLGKEIKSIKKNNLNILLRYKWPGNIRELEHLVERAIIISPNANLSFENLLNVKVKKSEKEFDSLLENEKEHIIKALKMANGKVTGKNSASEILGIKGKTLGSKMRKHGIKREDVLKS